jgi:secondary thiamine-phosphate synthase enzyme
VSVHGGLLKLSTAGDGDVVDITPGVEAVVRQSEVQSGVVTVFAPGATVGVTTIEFEPGAVTDLKAWFDQHVPRSAGGEHNALNGDTNGHAHLRAALVGPSESIPVVGGRLTLGTWQQIVLVDFDDRPRERQVTVHVVS